MNHELIISNGFSKFHLAPAGAEAERRGLLTSFITGAYPTSMIRMAASAPYLRNHKKIARLLSRQEKIADESVHALFIPEAIDALGRFLHSDALAVDALRLYGRSAVRHVDRAASKGARIYHYRAGFGGKSVEFAKRRGLFALCDHSIAHPDTVEALVRNKGQISSADEAVQRSPFWSYILHDIEQADAVLVNSHFVEGTFEQVGFNRAPVFVIYLGVDDSFLTQIPPRTNEMNRFRMLFAGGLYVRKGAEILIEALSRLEEGLDWQIEIAGGVDPELIRKNGNFFADPRVKRLGLLSRQEIAMAMTRAEVFVFPSLAEGSARVIFEALACGCYVITTPNSGSVVEDGVHGSLVPPGDSASLSAAITYASDHRDIVCEIGSKNARLVREKFRQQHYGDQLSALYGNLLAAHGNPVQLAKMTKDHLALQRK